MPFTCLLRIPRTQALCLGTAQSYALLELVEHLIRAKVEQTATWLASCVPYNLGSAHESYGSLHARRFSPKGLPRCSPAESAAEALLVAAGAGGRAGGQGLFGLGVDAWAVVRDASLSCWLARSHQQAEHGDRQIDKQAFMPQSKG